MTAGKDTESAGGGQSGAGAPTHDASLDELMKWAGQVPAKTTGSAPSKQAEDILSGRVVQRAQEEESKEPSRRRGFPPAWQIAIGALAVWAVAQFIASMLFMLGFFALAVAVVAGAYAIGKSRSGRR